MEIAYLNNAATTKIRPNVLRVITESLHNYYGNPSSTYSIGRQSKAAIELSRKKIASFIGVPSSDIIFTSGGTEANNMILHSVVESLDVKHIVTTKIEHHAVLNVIEKLVRSKKIEVTYLPVLSSGDVDLNTLENILVSNKDKTCVSLMHINNETGVITDLAKVGKLCKTFKALFHSDTVQSIGQLKLNLHEFNIDFASASAHKFYGPKGIGFAVIKNNLGLKSFMYGGEQERGLRPGTEAVHQIEAMARAIELCHKNSDIERAYIKDLKNYAIALIKHKLPSCSFNAMTDTFENRKSNIINVCLPISIEKASSLLFKLDMEGVCCSLGSACQSGSNKPSHVLKEFLPKAKIDQTSLRFSFSIYTKKEEINYMVNTISSILLKK